MKGKLLLGLCMMLFLVGFSYADDTVLLNMSEANPSASQVVNITLVQNHTVFIELIQSDARLKYAYTKQINLTDSNLGKLFIAVTPNSTLLENTNISAIFKISNDLNNNSINYTLITQIIPAQTIIQVEDMFVNIINGDYFLNISSNLLPLESNLDYELSGLATTQVNISCTGWMICPAAKTFNQNNKTSFSVNYTIPQNTTAKEYTYQITFKIPNKSLSKNITFNIYDPPILFQSYQFRDECFTYSKDDKLTVTFDCIQEMEEFNIKRLSEYLKLLRENTDDKNKTEKICQNITEYVYKGDINDALDNELTLCKTAKSKYQTTALSTQDKLNTCNSDLRTCQSTVSDLTTQILNNETACLQNSFSSIVKSQKKADEKVKEAEEDAKRYKNKVWLWVASVILVLLLITFGIYYLKSLKKESWSSW